MTAPADASDGAGPGSLTLRDAREADLADLARIYADAVSRLGPEHYAPDAVAAWSAFARDARFRDFILGPRTVVAEDDSGIVGFGGLGEDGHIASLYIRPDRARQGIGARILDELLRTGEALGIRRFHTEASEHSRPLFQRFGFEVVEVEVVERQGVQIERYRMERHEGGGSRLRNRRASLT